MIIQDPIDKTIREATSQEMCKLVRTEGVTDNGSHSASHWIEHHLDGVLVKRDVNLQLK